MLVSGLTLRRAAIMLAVLTFAGKAPAQTWTGAISGIWNNGSNWNPVGVPASGISTRLIFDATNFPTMTNNIAGTFTLNRITFNAGSPAYALSGNPLDFEFGSFSFPAIVVNSNNNVTISDALTLGGNFSVSGSGTGTTALNGAIGGSGSLGYSGAGTLTLGAANNYSGGTSVSSGTLMLGTGTAIPASTPVTVAAGAQFNIGSLSNSAATAIGALTLNGGTFRVPSGSGDYFVNQLNMTGGTVDFTGSGNFWLHFMNSGAGITTNASSTTATWIGSSTSRIQNDTASPLTITVNAGTTPTSVDLDAGIILSAGGSNSNFVKAGAGNMRLSNTQNSANITVNGGYLFSNDLSTNLGSGAFGTLGTGTITLNNGGVYYDGATASSSKSLTLGAAGSIQVASPGTNLTMSGGIGESSPGAFLNVYGSGNSASPSTLTLTGSNTYSGPTWIRFHCIVAVPTIGNSGVSGPLGTGQTLFLGNSGQGRGDLLLTGTNASYSTNRVVNVIGSYFANEGGAIGVQNAGTNLTWNGQIGGTGSLIKTGAGTLTLTNASNNYAGDTYIEAGTLNLGAYSAIPTDTSVTVFAGAALRLSYIANGLPHRTLALNGGTVSAAAGIDATFQMNRLATDGSGGTVNFGGSNAGLSFSGANAGIIINGNSTWSGGPSNWINNSSTALMDITIAPGTTLTSSLALHSAISDSSVFRLSGGGTLYMISPPNSLSSFLQVSQGRLRVDDLTTNGSISVLGIVSPGFLTIDGGILQYSGPTASSPIPVTLTSAGGTLEVSNPATTLTYTGALSGFGPFIKGGPGVLILNNLANGYASGLVVSGGRLDVNDDAQLGAASPTVNPAGTLRYTASAPTSRTFNLAGGTLEVPSSVMLTLNGATVNGGFLRGAGSFVLTGGAALNGASTLTSTTLVQTGPASVANFSNGGVFTVSAGQTLAWNGGTNSSSGRLTVLGTVNAPDFVSNGQATIAPNASLNGSAGGLVFGGGSVTNIGIYNPANGQVTPGGTINIGSSDMRVQGGFVRNNGTITDTGNPATSGRLIIDYGGLVKGAGTIDLSNQIIRINGGQLLAGNSPGLTRVTNFSLVSTGVTGGDFSNATGIAGPPIGSTGTQLSGFSVFEYGNSANTGGSAQVQGTPAARAIWQFRTVVDGGDYSTAGVPANFNAAQSFTWGIVRPRSNADVGNPNNITPINTVAQLSIFDTATMTTVALNNANLNAYLRFDDTAWNWGSVPVDQRGSFAFVLLPDASGALNRVIGLTYTPVPEPMALFAVTLGGLMVGNAIRRCRRPPS